MEAIRESLLIVDADANVQSANNAFYRIFRMTPELTVNRCVYDLGDRPKLRELVERVIRENGSFDDYEVELDIPGIGRKMMRLNARRIDQTGDRPCLLVGEGLGVGSKKVKKWTYFARGRKAC